MDASAHFRGKRVTVMGLGVLGRGVGDVRYLAECGAELIVTDLKPREALTASLEALAGLPGITYVLGEHRLEDFRGRDLVVKAAGVPLDSPYVAEAKKHGVPVRMSADLFMELSGLPCVGVTGTRGKSTTTHMLAAMLRAAGKRVLLGGNVRGVSTLTLLKEVRGDEIAVLELDSWQCQGLGEAGISPHIAVFATFYPDHLNYYKDDLGAYLADKANIFLHQGEGDTLVLGKQASALVIERYGEQIESRVVIIDETKLPDTWALKVPGVHNRYNAALALAAARAMDVPDEASRKALEGFAGVPGRLEYLGEKRGIKIYNDNNSTTPEATLAALAALDPARTILIMGGADKALDMSALLARLPELKAVILLAGTGTERVAHDVQEGAGGRVSGPYDKLSRAVGKAFELAVVGDTILFSPAFASFGMFTNEYDRGDQFTALVKAL